VLGEHGRDLGSDEIFEQRVSPSSVLCRNPAPGRERHVVLQLVRQRADELETGQGQNLADERERDLGFSA